MPIIVDDWWRGKIFEIYAEAERRGERIGADAISTRLEKAGLEEGREDFPPSSRTIGRRIYEYRKMEEKAKRPYRRVFFPESFGDSEGYGLPWRTAPNVLDLLEFCWKKGFSRPTVRHARWFSRLALAAPDTPINTLHLMSRLLAAMEAAGQDPENEMRAVEGYLAFRPWRKENQDDYRKAIQRGVVPRPVYQPGPFKASSLPDELRDWLPPDLLESMKGDAQ